MGEDAIALVTGGCASCTEARAGKVSCTKYGVASSSLRSSLRLTWYWTYVASRSFLLLLTTLSFQRWDCGFSRWGVGGGYL